MLNWRCNISSAKTTDLGLTQVYLLIGSIENWQGNFPPARQAFEQAYHHCKKTNNLRNLSSVINRLADLYCYQGKYDKGIELYQEALGYNQQLGDRYHQAMSLQQLGDHPPYSGELR